MLILSAIRYSTRFAFLYHFIEVSGSLDLKWILLASPQIMQSRPGECASASISPWSNKTLIFKSRKLISSFSSLIIYELIENQPLE